MPPVEMIASFSQALLLVVGRVGRLCGIVTFYQGSVCGSAPVASDSCESMAV